MDEPSPRRSRLALAGGLAAAIVVGSAGFLLGRETAEPPRAAVSPPVAAPAPKPVVEAAVLSGVLGRSELIALAEAAADAAGSGRNPELEVVQADGRRFELRLPFGCNGPSGEDSDAAMRWRYDAEDEVLRIQVDPVTWTAQDWWSETAAAPGIDAIEGFWITRPWTKSEACPAAGDRPTAMGESPVLLPGQTLAVGQIFFEESPRGVRRNGRSYKAVARVPQGELDTSAGFALRLSGRIARTRGAGTVRCRQPAGPEQRPICLVSVVTDEVAIENPATGETLATWSLGARASPEP